MSVAIRERVDPADPAAFDRCALPAYLLLAFSCATGAVLMLISGVRFAPVLVLTIVGSTGWLLLLAWLLRRSRFSRLATIFDASTIGYAQGLTLLGMTYPLAILSGHFADGRLAAADRALGFDWLSFCRWVEAMPVVLSVLYHSYWSFQVQPIVIVVALAVTNRDERLWRFVSASAFSGIVAAFLFALFPAEGAFRHFGSPYVALPHITAVNAWRFGDVIYAVKSGHITYIDGSLVAGIISFPSYHTVEAVLFAWAAWPVRSLRWPVLMLNLAMVLGAIPLGAHYLIDIIGGAAVGCFSIVVAQFLGKAAVGAVNPPSEA